MTTFFLVLLVGTLFVSMVMAFCTLFKRAGFHPLWGLICLIPGVGVFLAFGLLAFRQWPNLNNEARVKPEHVVITEIN